MTFYYSMYGSTVESLSVYVRISGSEERIWSRHGNKLSSNWTKGCVAINYNGTYQVEPFRGYFCKVVGENDVLLQWVNYRDGWVTYQKSLVNKDFAKSENGTQRVIPSKQDNLQLNPYNISTNTHDIHSRFV